MDGRLGQILVRKGILDSSQVQRVLDEQARTGAPFGLICERLLGVPAAKVEEAWVSQYVSLTRSVDLSSEQIDPSAVAMLTRRQAWQFAALPIGWDEGGELVIATSENLLLRAHAFVSRTLDRPFLFVMASADGLKAALHRVHPLPGAVLPVGDEAAGRAAA